MSTTKDIVVVGLSSGGMNVAHYFLKHTLSTLKTSLPSEKFRVVLVDQSTKFWWRIGSPRSMVSKALLPDDKTFVDIAECFEQYPKENWTFIQGTAKSVDTQAKNFTYESTSGSTESISYAAIVIATGTSTPSKLTSLQGDYLASQSALDIMNKRLANAKEVVIVGGGPIGVETAGEVGEQFNGAAGMFKSRPEQKLKITLIAGAPKLLPLLGQSISDKAEKLLNRVGVDVVYGSKVKKVELSEADAAMITIPEPGIEEVKTNEARTKVYLDNGTTLDADVYIPASGIIPNSSWLPKQFLDERGFIKPDNHMRLAGNGETIYAVGDITTNTRGALDIYASVPVLLNSMAIDLQKASGASTKLEEKTYTQETATTMLVPVGRSKGVGAMKGYSLPSLMIWGLKGRNYMTNFMPQTTHGTKW